MDWTHLADKVIGDPPYVIERIAAGYVVVDTRTGKHVGGISGICEDRQEAQDEMYRLGVNWYAMKHEPTR